MKDKLTTTLLALFLGTLGIHRFYLGQVLYGICYVILAATGISTIIAFIDFIMFLIMDKKEFDKKYNSNGGLWS